MSSGQTWKKGPGGHGVFVSCDHCGVTKTCSRVAILRGDDDQIMSMVPCEGSAECRVMLCESCKHVCPSCDRPTCREHLALSDQADPFSLECETCRSQHFEAEADQHGIASQETAALTVAMAERAIEDAGLVEGAELSIYEARFCLELLEIN